MRLATAIAFFFLSPACHSARATPAVPVKVERADLFELRTISLEIEKLQRETTERAAPLIKRQEEIAKVYHLTPTDKISPDGSIVRGAVKPDPKGH